MKHHLFRHLAILIAVIFISTIIPTNTIPAAAAGNEDGNLNDVAGSDLRVTIK